MAKDQQVLSYLLNSLTPEILAQVIGKESTHDLWIALTTLFAAQSQSRITNLRIAISNTKKGNMSSNSFIAKMKSLGDELAAAGRPVTDGEMVDYILAGLDRDYDPIVAAVGAIKNSITVDDLFSQIAAFDQRMEMLGDGPSGFRSSANTMYRGRGQYRNRGSRGRGNRGRGRGNRAPSSSARGGGGNYQQRQQQPPQQQQQLALQAQQNMASPTSSDVDSRRLRMMFNNRNVVLGRDGQTTSGGDIIPNIGSPSQSGGDIDMLIKVDLFIFNRVFIFLYFLH